MKKLRAILLYTVQLLVGLNLAALISLNVPYVQEKIGGLVSGLLSDFLHTEVQIGRVDMGLLNQVILSDVLIKDQQQDTLLVVQKLAGKVDLELFRPKRIAFNTIQLLHFKANLYKTAENEPTNFQFFLDAFKSNNPSGEKTNVRINSLIVRDGDIAFNKRYEPKKEQFDVNHLHFQDFNAHVSIKSILTDSLRVRVRNMNFQEQSGLRLNNLMFTAQTEGGHALLTDFELKLPHSSITTDTISASYDLLAKNVLETLHSTARLKVNPITLSDLKAVVPQFKEFDERIFLDLALQQDGYKVQVNQLNVQSENGEIKLNTQAQLQLPKDSTETLRLYTQVKELDVQPSALPMLFENLKLGAVPSILTRLGHIHFTGEVTDKDGIFGANGLLNTAIGQVKTNVHLYPDKTVKGSVSTEGVEFGTLLANNQLGMLACDVNVDGKLVNGKPLGKVVGHVDELEYKNYPIRNIDVDGTLTAAGGNGLLAIHDDNIQVDIDGEALMNQTIPAYHLNVDVEHLHPSVLGVQTNHADRSYKGKVQADFTGSNVDNLLGKIDVENFELRDSLHTYHLNELKLHAADDENGRRMSLYSDFMTAEVQGNYLYSTLPQSFFRVLEQYIPSLIGYEKRVKDPKNHFSFNIHVTDATLLKELTGVDLQLEEPMSLTGFVNDPDNRLDIEMNANSFTVNGGHYEQGHIRCLNNDNAFVADVNVNKFNKASMLSLGVHAQAKDDQLTTGITWDNNKETGKFNGQLNALTRFEKVPNMPMHVDINVTPSQAALNDTLWTISPAHIDIQGKEYAVSNLNIQNGERHLRVNGKVSDNPSDSLIADLSDINIEYVLGAVNFTAVRFGGLVSGRAFASNLLHTPKADARLFIKDFTFEKGPMGNMNLYGKWEPENAAIYLDGHISEFDGKDPLPVDSTKVWKAFQGTAEYVGLTHVNGRISPKHNTIELDVDANNTNLAFLEGFVGTIFDHVGGRGTGHAHIGNTLKNIDLTADIKAKVSARVICLNTYYNITTDHVNFVTNHMMFRDATLTDRDGRTGTAYGDVYHDYLHKLQYDFHVNSENLLCYETHNFGDDMPFYATAYAGGDIRINGGPGIVSINADVTANKGTIMVYDATIPEEVSNTQFINFVDKTPRTTVNVDEIFAQNHTEEKKVENNAKESTNIYIDMNVETTPDATIRVLMDKRTGDFISCNGTGNLQASYYNKGSFKMFGIYNITKGLYRMSMQEVIRKDFNLQSGSTVDFNGNPFDATLNVKAAYTIPAVSLRDLSPTATFVQKTSTRVNCLMDIEGSLRKPAITFDLELPQVNEEDKSMVKSLVATDDQLNMQIIYLLSIGRFYGGEYAQSTGNQTNQAMNSILTSTVSGQFNQMLSQVINNNNWSLGANINPGQKGMNDMEFQTMLQGSLFNNRLLVNGNFGYKENVMMNTNFVGDFDIQWLLNKAGTISLKAYNETNDRYFTRNTLNTQGIGIQFRKDFNNWGELFKKSK